MSCVVECVYFESDGDQRGRHEGARRRWQRCIRGRVLGMPVHAAEPAVRDVPHVEAAPVGVDDVSVNLAGPTGHDLRAHGAVPRSSGVHGAEALVRVLLGVAAGAALLVLVVAALRLGPVGMVLPGLVRATHLSVKDRAGSSAPLHHLADGRGDTELRRFSSRTRSRRSCSAWLCQGGRAPGASGSNAWHTGSR